MQPLICGLSNKRQQFNGVRRVGSCDELEEVATIEGIVTDGTNMACVKTTAAICGGDGSDLSVRARWSGLF
jgi:hypothetical protein